MQMSLLLPQYVIAETHQELNSGAFLRILMSWAKPWVGSHVYDTDQVREIFLQRGSSLGMPDYVEWLGESIPLSPDSAFQGGWREGYPESRMSKVSPRWTLAAIAPVPLPGLRLRAHRDILCAQYVRPPNAEGDKVVASVGGERVGEPGRWPTLLPQPHFLFRSPRRANKEFCHQRE